jgi:hypothetical protein
MVSGDENCRNFALSEFSMKTVRHTGIFFLLFVFLFSSTGISILHHICSTSNNDLVSIYPEFFKTAGSSCCEPDEANSPVEPSESQIPQNFSAMPCCSNITSFLKLEIVTLRAEKLVINSFTTCVPQYTLALPEIKTNESFSIPGFFFQFYSPPLSGKRLIYFLHQSKIPPHPSLT